MRKRRFSRNQKNKPITWENSIKILFTSLTAVRAATAYADTPTGLIGGSPEYAVFVFSNGTVAPITDVPLSTEVFGVAINQSIKPNKKLSND